MKDPMKRLQVLKSCTRHMDLKNSHLLEEIEKEIPLNLTGADIFALCSKAYRVSLKKKEKEILQKGKEHENEFVDFEAIQIREGLKTFKQSLQPSELERYRKMADLYADLRIE